MSDDEQHRALRADLSKYIDAAARQRRIDFLADPQRFLRPHLAQARLFDRWDELIQTKADLTQSDLETNLQVTTTVGYTVHRTVIPLGADHRYQVTDAMLQQVQQDLGTLRHNTEMTQALGLPDPNRQAAATLQDLHDTLLRLAVPPPCVPGVGRCYVPFDPIYPLSGPPQVPWPMTPVYDPPFPRLSIDRTLATIYHPSGTMVMPVGLDPGPVQAVPQIARHGGARYRVGETVLWQGGTVTIERRFRMLWKWRYTIDGPAILCEVDEEELAPV